MGISARAANRVICTMFNNNNNNTSNNILRSLRKRNPGHTADREFNPPVPILGPVQTSI